MTIQEDAERLRSIASSDYLPIGLTREIQTRLLEINAVVSGILGDTPHAQHIANLAGIAAEQYGTAVAALQHVESAIHDAADYHARG